MQQQEGSFVELILKVIIPKFTSFIIIWTQILMTLMIGATTLFRYVFHIDLYGAEEFVLIFSFWLYMMGAAYGSFEGSHIKADILEEYIKNEKLKLRIQFFVSLISTVMCLVLNYWAFNYFVWGIVKHARSIAWKIPMVIPQSSLLIGFTIMSVYSCVNSYRIFHSLIAMKSSTMKLNK